MEHLELVMKAINGDGESFYQLILPKQDDFYRIAYSYVKNKEDALDIIHETVYKAFKSLKGLKKPEFFYTWLTRILINTSIDYAKKNWKVFYLFTNSLMYANNYMNYGLNKDEKIYLYSAIDTLKENYKSVIILKYFNGMTLNEIAELLEVPLGTVKTNLHKALVALRNELKEEIRFAPAYRPVRV
jgi:RNA polymerase sigma-70 factor (ECF subfamily)